MNITRYKCSKEKNTICLLTVVKRLRMALQKHRPSSMKKHCFWNVNKNIFLDHSAGLCLDVLM